RLAPAAVGRLVVDRHRPSALGCRTADARGLVPKKAPRLRPRGRIGPTRPRISVPNRERESVRREICAAQEACRLADGESSGKGTRPPDPMTPRAHVLVVDDDRVSA